MIKDLDVNQMADTIRGIYSDDPQRGRAAIENYLRKNLDHWPEEHRVTALEAILTEFEKSNDAMVPQEEEILSRLFSMILGGQVSRAELSSAELLDRLAESLNTVFDSLNELILTIGATLEGDDCTDETIRRFIGGHLHDENQSASLGSYLGKIRHAFLASHQAFQKAAQKIVGDILDELDPESIGERQTGRIKFGPFRKAESYDTYRHKYALCRQWFESDRFSRDILKEFENNCRKITF
jgi:hypothetical protein